MVKKEKAVNKFSFDMFGKTAFIVGFFLAIFVGLADTFINQTWIVSALVIIGVLVGLLNVTEKETQPFLISVVVLIISSAFGLGALGSIPILARILVALLTIFVPITIIVAIKNVYFICKRLK